MSSNGGRRPGIGLRRMVASLVRQRRRLALATLAVALGVGYLAGALTLLDRVGAGLDNLAAAGAERADLIIEGEVAYESALEQTRRLVPSSIAPTVSSLPGVAAVVPRVEEVTVLLGPDGVPLVAPGLSEQPLGSNWPEDDAMSPYRFVGDGRPPERPGEVVIDERSARAAGLGVGDDIFIVAKTAPAPFEITGIVTTAEGELPDGSSLALFSTERARELFEMPTNDNRIAVRLDEGADEAALTRQIASLLPPGAEVVDGATGAEHRQVSLTRSFSLIRVLIIGFAGLALVVGMVTVANSLTLLYTERRRTFAALRLVGAKQHQLVAAALIEAAMLATVAGLAGVPLGLVLGRVIEAVLGALGTSVPVAGSVVSVSALVWAVLIGVAATVLAAVIPAYRACSVPAIEAVADAPGVAAEPPIRRILNSALVAVGAASLLAGLMILADVHVRVVVGVAAGLVVLWMLLALLPWALSLAVAAGIRLVPTRPPALRRIGARDAVRNRARTAATTGALLLATAVVAGLAVFLTSFASSIDGDVNELVRSDLVVDSGTFTRGGLPGQLLDELGELPEVAAVSGWQVGRVWSGGVPLRLTGIDGDALGDVLAPGWVGPAPGELTPGGIAIGSDVATALGVTVGDTIPVEFTSGGVEQLQVQGVYDTGEVLLGEAVIDRSTLMGQVPASVDIAALVALEGAGAGSVDAVEQLAGSFGVTSVLEPSGFVDRRSDLLRGFERVIQWMLLFTLLQALVGVVNTLLLSVGERRREFGLLRVSGASRRQIHALVLVEGMSFAVVGTALGLVVGVAGAAAAIGALGRFGISGLDLPVVVLMIVAGAAMALGVLAAVVPARWAAAVAPLDAVVDTGALTRGRRRGTPRGEHPLSASPADVAATPAVPPPFIRAATDSSTPPPYHGAIAPEVIAAARLAEAVPVDAASASRPEVASPAPAGAPPIAPPLPHEPPPVAPPPIAPLPPEEPPSVDRPADQPSPDDESPARPTPATADAPSPFSPGPAARDQPPASTSPDRDDAPVAGSAVPTDDGAVPTEGGGWLRPPTTPPPAREPIRQPVFEPEPVRATEAAGAPSSWHLGGDDEVLDPAVLIRLRDVLGRLDPNSRQSVRPLLGSVARTLLPDEPVGELVAGWVQGMPCVVARTDHRLIVVVDQFPAPTVEVLPVERVRISLFGPPRADHVSLAIVDRRRLLEVTGVREREQAAAMQSAPSSRSPDRSQYF